MLARKLLENSPAPWGDRRDYPVVLVSRRGKHRPHEHSRGKARGVRLGRHGAEVLAPKFKEEARQRAMELEPVITELKEKGLSLAKISGELNKRKVATPRGGKWDHSSVGNVLQRLAA